jgi:hypothetical protein
MASIYKELSIDVAAQTAWAALRAVGDAAKAFTPVVADSRLDGDTRTIRFGNGLVISERILDIDDGRRRVAYSAVNAAGMLFHHASMQIVEDGPNRCRFVWITDFHPQEIAGNLAPLIDQGTAALKKNLEKS